MNEQNQILEQRKLKITGEETIYRHNNTPLFLAWVTVLGFAAFAWYQWQVWLNIVAVAVILVGGLVVIYLMVTGAFSVSLWLLSWGGREAIPVARDAQVIIEKSLSRSHVPSYAPKSLPNPKDMNKRLPAPSLKEITEQLYRGGK